jgi:hypothetical protein
VKQARRDLAHVNASLRLFVVEDQRLQFPAYVDINRLFRRGEMYALCKKALEEAGEPLTIRELALLVFKAKGLEHR